MVHVSCATDQLKNDIMYFELGTITTSTCGQCDIGPYISLVRVCLLEVRLWTVASVIMTHIYLP